MPPGLAPGAEQGEVDAREASPRLSVGLAALVILALSGALWLGLAQLATALF